MTFITFSLNLRAFNRSGVARGAENSSRTADGSTEGSGASAIAVSGGDQEMVVAHNFKENFCERAPCLHRQFDALEDLRIGVPSEQAVLVPPISRSMMECLSNRFVSE
jgi:hypothetical protein